MTESTSGYSANAPLRPRSVVAMPLSMASVGSLSRVVRIDAGRGLCERLTAMGLVPGECIEVINVGGRGPMIISVKGSRIILGRGMALKIMVD